MTWTTKDLAGLRVIGDTSKPGKRISPETRESPPAESTTTEVGYCVRPEPSQAPPRGDDASPRSQRIHIPAIAPSINGLYTMHPMTRSIRAKEFKNLVIFCARDQGIVPVERYPVTVHVVCWFGPGKRQYDAENLALSAKFAGDGLRAAGILENDSPAYVASVTLEPRRTERESYMEYFIHELNEG